MTTYVNQVGEPVFGQSGFDKYENGVVGTNLNSVESFAGEPVDVESEQSVVVVAKRDVANTQYFVVVIIDGESMSRRAVEGVYLTHFKGVDRKRRLMGGGGGDAIFDT